MAPSPLELAFAELAKSPFNLLTENDDLLAGLRPHWVDWESNGRKGKSTDKSKAVVYWDNTPAVISLIGVLDPDKSQLGHYGNLWFPSGGRNFTPEFSDLQKARFVVHLTYPRGDGVKLPDRLVEKTTKQVLLMYKVQSAINALLSKDPSLQNVDDDKISDCVDFERNSSGLTGSIKAILGNVYASAVQKVKGKDVTELSPSKSTGEPPVAVRCDEHGLFSKGRVPKSNTLQPTEGLPVFLPDGTPARARDSEDLSLLLYGGKWFTMDVRMIVWNISSARGRSRAFTLEIVKLQLIANNSVLNPNFKFLKPNSLTETDGDVPQDLIDAATNTHKPAAVEDDETGESDKKDAVEKEALHKDDATASDDSEDSQKLVQKSLLKRTAEDAGLDGETSRSTRSRIVE